MAAPLPTVDMNRRGDTLPSKIHIAMLGFMPCCTLKPPPSAHTSLEAAEHFLTCGFLTNEKPLLAKHLHQEDHLSVEVPCGSKKPQACQGMPRASTALALLHIFWTDGDSAALLATFPVFRDTCTTVYCHHVVLSSLESEMVQNFD